jgi:DNA repair protein RecO (recombination protein O)
VPESHSSLAVVLRWRAYGESDKIATLLTRDFGKLTGIAKGAKRSQRRFANSLEPLARVRVHFRRRPESSLSFLERCDLLAPADNLLEPAKFAYGSYLLELVDQLTVEDNPTEELYDLLDQALTALQRGPATGTLLRAFELQLLVLSGYAPRLDRCLRCQCVLADGGAAVLDPQHGTFSCRDCRDPSQAAIEIAPQVLQNLAVLGETALDDCRRLSFGDRAEEAAQLTGRLLALHLHRPLRSLRLIAQIGVTSA